MTDKEYREQKARIQRFTDKWFSVMGLGWFKVNFEWARHEEGDTAASTHSDWQYKSATITWYLPHIARYDDDVVEQTVVHEFTHILLSGIAQNMIHDDETMTNQINEYTTELVANALIWVREAEKKDQKRETNGQKKATGLSRSTAKS